MSERHQYSVYILSNWSGSVLYTGVTNNLKRRVQEHRDRLVPGFTAKYNVSRLVYYITGDLIEVAIAYEKKIKSGSRRKKVLLISKFNPAWIDLFDRL